MAAVYDKLVKNRDKLADLARAQISSMKGGRAGAMLNPRASLASSATCVGPSGDSTSSRPRRKRATSPSSIAKSGLQFAPAAAAEWALRRQWLSEMEASFGPDATRARVVVALDEARQAAFDAGIGSQNSSRPLLNALERVQEHVSSMIP